MATRTHTDADFEGRFPRHRQIPATKGKHFTREASSDNAKIQHQTGALMQRPGLIIQVCLLDQHIVTGIGIRDLRLGKSQLRLA